MKCLAFLALAICPALAQAQEFLNDGRITPDVNLIENDFSVSMASNGQELLMASFEWYGPGTPAGAAVYSSSSRGGLDLIQKLAFPTGVNQATHLSTAISANYAAVGVPGSSSFGLVAIYERDGGAWTHSQNLIDPNILSLQDHFGATMAFSGDTLIVGDKWDPSHTASLEFAGAVYVYKNLPTTGWTLTQTLEASNAKAKASFGTQVVVDGDRLMVVSGSVSAPQAAEGVAYIFEDDGSGTWIETARIDKPAHLEPGSTGQIKHAMDGDRLYFTDSDLVQGSTGLQWSGMVSIYKRQASGEYILEQQIQSPSPTESEVFRGVTARDGKMFILVARSSYPESAPLLGYLYERNSSTDQLTLSATVNSSEVKGPDGNDYIRKAGGAAHLFGGQLFVQEDFRNLWLTLARSVAFYQMDSLFSDERELRLADGGTQELSLRAGAAHAGEGYILVGSASGTLPGMTIPGTSLVINLVPDVYTTFLLTSPAAGSVLQNGIGVLDANGFGQCNFNLPTNLSPALAGITLNHAYLLSGPAGFTFASESEDVLLVP